MKNISKYLLVAALGLCVSACHKPGETSTTTSTTTTTTETTQTEIAPSTTPSSPAAAGENNTAGAPDAGWHHCTADVDCVVIKANDCAYSVDARFEKQARLYYGSLNCTIGGVHRPEAVCKHNSCEIRAR